MEPHPQRIDPAAFAAENREASLAYEEALNNAINALQLGPGAHDDGDVATAVENAANSLADWEERASLYRAAYDQLVQLNPSILESPQTDIDLQTDMELLRAHNEQLQKEIQELNPAPSDEKEALITDAKEFFQKNPWIFDALRDDEAFSQELRQGLDSTTEKLRADSQKIDERMRVLETTTLYEIKQLSSPEECDKRLKPFHEREKENDKVLEALKKYVAQHKTSLSTLAQREQQVVDKERELASREDAVRNREIIADKREADVKGREDAVTTSTSSTAL
ncbi:MAG: hypothetical protein Q9195_002502 [Heterodermia aff. obscurata]